jgi:alcohol dehydrogenase class IV
MAWVQALVTDLAIPPLSRHGLSAAEIPAVVVKVEQAASMKGNPVVLSAADLTAILAEALG